jgi:hypothetical protein
MSTERFGRVHDDDLRQLVTGLDRVRIGLDDLEAVLSLHDDPYLQHDVWGYARIVRQAADYLFHLREDRHG